MHMLSAQMLKFEMPQNCKVVIYVNSAGRCAQRLEFLLFYLAMKLLSLPTFYATGLRQRVLDLPLNYAYYI